MAIAYPYHNNYNFSSFVFFLKMDTVLITILIYSFQNQSIGKVSKRYTYLLT